MEDGMPSGCTIIRVVLLPQGFEDPLLDLGDVSARVDVPEDPFRLVVRDEGLRELVVRLDPGPDDPLRVVLPLSELGAALVAHAPLLRRVREDWVTPVAVRAHPAPPGPLHEVLRGEEEVYHRVDLRRLVERPCLGEGSWIP